MSPPRILRDPAPVDGGGIPPAAPAPPAAPPPNPNPAAQQPPAAPAAPTPAVPIPADEAARLYAAAKRLTEIEAAKQRELEAKEQEKILALAQKGEVTKAFDQFRTEATTKYSTLEQKFLDREKSLVVAEALAGRTFLSDAAKAQVKDILSGRIEAVLSGEGAVLVRDRATGRPAADVLREAMDSADFAHFQPPKTTGGSGASGGAGQPPTPPPGDGKPPSFEEQVVANWKNRAGNLPSGFTPVGRPPRRS